MDRIEQLKKYLEVSPNDSFLHHALALECIKVGDDNIAKGLFENILHNEPSYVGSYYHLAKLLERLKDHSTAIDVYRKGMAQAKLAKDNHTYNELQAALEDLED